VGIYEDFMKNKSGAEATPPTGGNSIYERFMSQSQKVTAPPPPEEDKGIVSTAIEYLGKPASAVAGAAQYLTDTSQDESLMQAISRGWEQNADWKPVINKYAPDLEKEHPVVYEGLNMALNIAADPLWVLTPAKLARATGLAKIGARADEIARAFVDSERGQKILNSTLPLTDTSVGNAYQTVKRSLSPTGPLDELLEKRLMGILDDEQKAKGVMEGVGKTRETIRDELIKQGVSPNEADDIAGKLAVKYVEARPDIGKFAPGMTEPVIESERIGVVEALKNKTLPQAIIDGQVTKEQAIDAIVRSGERVPSWLLGEEQRAAIKGEMSGLRQAQRELKAAEKAGRGMEQWGEDVRVSELVQEIGQRKNAVTEIARNSGRTRSQVLDEARGLGLTEDTVQRLYQTGEETASLMDKFTRELHKIGLIDDNTMVKFLGGTHLRREYTRNISPEKFIEFVKETGTPKEVQRAVELIDQMKRSKEYKGLQGIKLNLDNLTKRLALSEETQQKLGRVYNAEYLVGKSSQVSSELVHTANFLKDVADNYATAKPTEGFRKFVGKEFGPLEGRWVPENIYAEVQRQVGEFKDVPGTWRKVMGWWKMGKTVLNPATHARNFMSNLILLNIGGIPAYDVATYVPKAMLEMKRGGEAFKEAQKVSPFLSEGFARGEKLREMLEEGVATTRTAKTWNMVKGGVRGMADFYQKNEQVGKLAAYMWAKDHGMAAEQAAKFADNLLFNYSKVPPVVDFLRRSGLVPFASFPYFATKATAEALWERPANVAKYYKAVNSQQDQDEMQLLPDYMEPRNLLPIDKFLQGLGIDRTTRMVNGQPQKIKNYLDLQYINPMESQVGVSPVFGLSAAIMSNRDPFTKKDIVRPGMTEWEAKSEQAKYVAKALAPTVTGYSAEKIYNALMGLTDAKGRQFQLPEAIAQTIFGLKTVPINLEEQTTQRLMQIKNEQDAVKKEIRRVMMDRRLTNAEKTQRQNDYMRKLNELSTEARRVSTSAARMKEKEGR
jgi:predicted Zn-ribbon and HTH transcriptional regulator